ncbi:MAG: hypothetical protein R6X02_31080 [Enhygromyxa sp.]
MGAGSRPPTLGPVNGGPSIPRQAGIAWEIASMEIASAGPELPGREP